MQVEKYGFSVEDFYLGQLVSVGELYGILIGYHSISTNSLLNVATTYGYVAPLSSIPRTFEKLLVNKTFITHNSVLFSDYVDYVETSDFLLISLLNLVPLNFIAHKTDPRAIIPTKDFADSGFDFYAIWDEDVVILAPGEVKAFPTGLKLRFPHTHTGLFRERGSTGLLNLQVRSGVIEGNFTNNYALILSNGNKDLPIIFAKDPYDIQTIMSKFSVFNPNTTLKSVSVVADDFKRLILTLTTQVGPTEIVKNLAYIYLQSKAVSQMILLRKSDWDCVEIPSDIFEKIPTDRGLGMFGSSGK